MEISFGKSIEGTAYKVLDERQIRASSGIMFLLGLIAFINGFIMEQYQIIPYVSGFLLVNFLLGVFFNPQFSPTMFLGRLFVRKQTELPIGAIQKRFAWSLGLGLSVVIFGLSLMLLNDVSYFEPVCFLCLICLILLFFETAFGICIGCKLYFLSIRMKLIKQPDVTPNCMGDSCEVKP